MTRNAHGRRRAWRGLELGTIVALLLLSLATWFFFENVDDVFAGETREFDESVMLASRSDADRDDPRRMRCAST